MPIPVVPVVSIEIPAEVPPDLATVLLRSCNLALGTGRCAAASEPAPTQNLAWVASFLVDPTQPTQLRVDLRNATPRGTQTRLTRTLGFEGNEGPAHRWSTAGVVVAALVVSAESTSRNAPAEAEDPLSPETPGTVTATPKPKASPTPPSPRAPEPAPKLSRAVRIDVGGLFGTGVEDGHQRFGGRLRPSIELSRLAFAWSDFALARSEATVETWFWSGAAGLGFVTQDADHFVGIEGRLGVRGDRLEFKAANGALTDQDSRLRGGAVAGVDFSLSVSRPLALWLGAEAAWLFPRVNVNVSSNQVGQLGGIDGLLSAGLRYRLDFDSR